MCFDVLPACVSVYHLQEAPSASEGGTESPRAGITNSWGFPCGCYELNSVLIWEYPVLFNTEPFLQTQSQYFKGLISVGTLEKVGSVQGGSWLEDVGNWGIFLNGNCGMLASLSLSLRLYPVSIKCAAYSTTSSLPWWAAHHKPK